MAADKSGGMLGVVAPLVGAFAITPDNDNDLPFVTRQIRLPDSGTAGNVVVVWVGGVETTERIAPGDVFDWRIERVKATGTTAVGLRGYY